jgi:hypothetical protein
MENNVLNDVGEEDDDEDLVPDDDDEEDEEEEEESDEEEDDDINIARLPRDEFMDGGVAEQLEPGKSRRTASQADIVRTHSKAIVNFFT